MKYMTGTMALTGGILKILSLANLSDGLYLSAAVLPVKILHIWLSYYVAKFAKVSCGIWLTGPWNSEKFVTDNMWSVIISNHTQHGDKSTIHVSNNKLSFQAAAMLTVRTQLTQNSSLLHSRTQ